MQGARELVELAELLVMASVTMAKEKEKILNFQKFIKVMIIGQGYLKEFVDLGIPKEFPRNS